MDFEDIKSLYERKREQYKEKAWEHVSELFEEAKERFIEDYRTSDRATKKLAKGESIDPEQAWKNFKGKSFERLILHMTERETEELGLRCIWGDEIEKSHLTKELSQIRRNLVIHYGDYDIAPDADLIIYEPKSLKIIGIISCKVTLRERIAQTAYWKLKLAADPVTESIRVYFITPDEDGDLIRGLNRENTSVRGFKNRILVEHELDGTYALRNVKQSEKVKTFDRFVTDLKSLLMEGKSNAKE